MSSLNSSCLKISAKGVVKSIEVFTFAHQRETWLLTNGFICLHGVYVHQDGRIAGKFSSNDAENRKKQNRWNDVLGFDNCDVPLQQHPMFWSVLLNSKTESNS
jgi:hypothetical protein